MSKIEPRISCKNAGKRNPVRLNLTDTRWYRVVWISIIALICLIISVFYLFSYQQMGKIYESETKLTIIELKKVFLKNTVDNLIEELDAARVLENERYRSIVDQRYRVYSIRMHSCDDFAQNLIRDFQPDYHAPRWTALIWEDSGAILYDTTGFVEEDMTAAIEQIKPLMAYYRIIRRDGTSCLFGFSKDYVDEMVKRSAATKIKSLYFGDNSYIWVNEILDYDGGKDYAIRRIHPNLPETEGMYLSTDMEDVEGNLPYLTELEGVKKDGELFFSYYFKELNSDNISEKLAYAKLYPEYNWIIAMGIQNNEMEQFIVHTADKSKALAFEKTVELLAIMLAVVLSCLILVFLVERRHFKHSKRQLELEFQFDPLTNAKSRRFGVTYMEETFRAFQNNANKPTIAVMLFDIDNFKNTNDRYGHSEGDRVLKEIVPTVYKSIRSSDELFRWGGDEFVGVFRVADEQNTVQLMEKILTAVSSLRLKTSNGLDEIETSISIGVSHFRSKDSGYCDALNRADQAMYQSKAEGGNRVTVL